MMYIIINKHKNICETVILIQHPGHIPSRASLDFCRNNTNTDTDTDNTDTDTDTDPCASNSSMLHHYSALDTWNHGDGIVAMNNQPAFIGQWRNMISVSILVSIHRVDRRNERGESRRHEEMRDER